MIELSKYDVVALDTETNGLLWWEHRPFALVYATPDGQSDCLDLRDPRVLSWARREIPKIRRVVGHNLKFDAHMLREVGVHIRPDSMVCTMVAAALLDEHLPSYSLDFVARKYVGAGKATDVYARLAEIFGGKAGKNQMENLHRAPWDLVRDYAIPDAQITLRLWQWQEGEIRSLDLSRVFDIEMRLLAVLIDIECRGVRVDVEMAERAVGEITRIVDRTQKVLNEVAGFTVNPNPSGSIKQLFRPERTEDGRWRLVDGTYAETTEGGEASISADVLRRMQHPAAAHILQLRQMIKTRDTFLRGHILGHHHEGIIHANFNQTKGENDRGTGTGRLSCNAPALQQIHKRNKEVARIVRAVFIPDEDQEWGSFDWDQFEFRWFGHYVNDPMINKAYRDDSRADFYSVIAKMTGLPRNPTAGVRGNAKQMVLASVFGMGAGKLAQEMGLPYSEEVRGDRTFLRAGPEAVEVMGKFYEAIPGIKAYLDKASNVARSRGFVRTALGRHLRFPGGQFTHKAGGLILQGSAADSMKYKLVQLHELLRGTEARMVLTVHDEIDITLPPGDDALRSRIVDCYTEFREGLIQCDIPITCGPGYGPNWWTASC